MTLPPPPSGPEAFSGDGANTESGTNAALEGADCKVLSRAESPGPVKTDPTKAGNRLSLLEAGRQPRWSCEEQLIADGLNDKLMFMSLAREL